MTKRQTVTLSGLIALSNAAGIGLLTWLALAARISSGGLAIGIVLIVLMIAVESVRLSQAATIMVFATKARDPIPLVPARNYRVAILTAIVPGKEPLSMAVKTLRAMKKITYPVPVDL